MAWMFNPPPSWPPPPPGWTPPPDWRPDPSWGPAPPGWQLWVPTGPTVIPEQRQDASRYSGLMIVLPTLSCGLAAFVPPLWAAAQRPQDRRFRRRMFLVSGALGALAVVGWTLLAGAPEDAAGSPTGAQSTLAGAALLATWILGTLTAVLVRDAAARGADQLPGVAEAMARRRLREQYRELVEQDPPLARSISVGRPDLARPFDDGGLVDLNSLPLDQLGRCTRLAPDEVRRVGEAHQRLGRFTTVEEVAVFAELSESSAAELREVAVFL